MADRLKAPQPIEYDHLKNLHSLGGAQAGLSSILEIHPVASLIDVGCGVGTWVRAAIEYGITDVCGLDGVKIDKNDLLFSSTLFRNLDLTRRWNLGRKFDLALCLEVGEHLPDDSAEPLIDSITAHSDVVVFSGACPGQIGQNHVNCQWPRYWQELFNRKGYICDDAIRWKIWATGQIEPWYRQNMFIATYAPAEAGKERRISPVIHPDMLRFLAGSGNAEISEVTLIEEGGKPIRWYFMTAIKACATKCARGARRMLRAAALS